MLPPQALMEAVSANLNWFLQIIGENLTKPQKKFLRDGLLGLRRAGRPVVCRMARRLPDQGTEFLSRLRRLEGHLNGQDDLDGKVKAALPGLWLPLVRDDTAIILDLSDVAKPLAKKMDYLATVRDGRTGQLVNGYWVVEMYASVSRKNPIPILMEPFSQQQPLCPGQNPILIGAVHWVLELTEKRGVLVVDRGGDARVLLEDWIYQGYRFVVRLRADRDLLRFYEGLGGQLTTVSTQREGQWIPVEARRLAEQTPTPHRSWRAVKRRQGRRAILPGRVGEGPAAGLGQDTDHGRGALAGE